MERVSDYVKKPEAVKMYLYHITIMCNHDEEMTSWFTRWHAQLIQFPAVKSRSPAFTSRQGAGKGEIILALQAMLGRLKVMETPNPAEDAFGKFNTLMVEALVVCFDELNAAALRLFLDRLKNAQTSGVINIEFKGQNKFMMNSIHRFMSAWNEGDPIPTGEDDRRNVIIRSSDELIGNTEYHVKFHAMLKDTNSVKSIYEYFKSTENFPDMALFHTVKPPVSDHHKDSKALNRSAPDIWLESFTQAKLDAFAAAGAAPCTIVVTPLVVYQQFTKWCGDHGFKYETNSQKLGIALKRLHTGGGVEKGAHDRGGDMKKFAIDVLGRHYGLSGRLQVAPLAIFEDDAPQPGDKRKAGDMSGGGVADDEML